MWTQTPAGLICRLRFQQAIANWNFLLQLGIYPGPLYLAFGGALWGILGLFAALALWYRLTWSAIATEVSVLLFAASYWIDRLVFNRSAVTQTNGFFAVGLTILGLIYSFGVSETLKRVIQ